jgi:hypothetical protein
MPRGKGSKRGSTGTGTTRRKRRPPVAPVPVAEEPAADHEPAVVIAGAEDTSLETLLAEAHRAVLAEAGQAVAPPPSVVESEPDPPVAAVAEIAPLDDLLSEAHRAVLEREERRVEERRHAGRQARPVRPIPNPAWLAAASFSWVLVVMALLFPPAILRAPTPVPFAPGAANAEASLRYGMWLARHRVDDFAARAGRLPSFLGETGMRDASITLMVTGERSYELRGRDGTMALALTRRMSADSFVGESRAQLGAR